MSKPRLSKYASQLEELEKTRYIKKIFLFKEDPYLMAFDEQVLPQNVSSIDTYEYIVNKKSFYTSNEFKAYKSLEAFKLYQSGWVQYLGGLIKCFGYIVFGKVRILFHKIMNIK